MHGPRNIKLCILFRKWYSHFVYFFVNMIRTIRWTAYVACMRRREMHTNTNTREEVTTVNSDEDNSETNHKCCNLKVFSCCPVCVHILVSWHDDGPSVGPKLVAVEQVCSLIVRWLWLLTFIGIMIVTPTGMFHIKFTVT
jgi:hypothetical protein